VRRADGSVLSWPTAGRSSLSTRGGTTRRTTQGSAPSDAALNVGVYASRPFDLSSCRRPLCSHATLCLVEDLPHCCQELLDADRLAPETVEPSGHDSLWVLGHHRGRDGGVGPVSGSARSSCRASMPLMPGSWMSIRMSAGCRSCARSTPSSPVSASMVW